MYHTFIQASRIVTFFGGLGAFCLAFMLYEQEENTLTDFLLKLWVIVDDRARHTTRRFVALFSTVAMYIKRSVTAGFGSRLLSFRAASISINLSWAGCLLFPDLADTYISVDKLYFPEWSFARFCLGLVCLYSINLCIFNNRRWAPWIGLLAIAAETTNKFTQLSEPYLMFLYMFMAFFSFWLAICILRSSMTKITTATSFRLVAIPLAALSATAAAIASLPYLTNLWINRNASTIDIFNNNVQLYEEIFVFVLPSLIVCLLPLIALLSIVLNRFLWPLLSRVVYSLTRREALGDRQLLVGFGILCLMYSMDLEKSIWAKILDVFKK